ncbi:MAG: hypothetical protein JRG91_09640 [Deltaproteobacteria bacterium]|nr:hypothetical protein [Deltaproteobacteria bacterium]
MQEATTPPVIGVAEYEEWFESFEAAARRSLAQRLKFAFVRTYKPVMDDATFRSFDTMDDYRRFCDTLPEWLGYGRV